MQLDTLTFDLISPLLNDLFHPSLLCRVKAGIKKRRDAAGDNLLTAGIVVSQALQKAFPRDIVIPLFGNFDQVVEDLLPVHGVTEQIVTMPFAGQPDHPLGKGACGVGQLVQKGRKATAVVGQVEQSADLLDLLQLSI